MPKHPGNLLITTKTGFATTAKVGCRRDKVRILPIKTAMEPAITASTLATEQEMEKAADREGSSEVDRGVGIVAGMVVKIENRK